MVSAEFTESSDVAAEMAGISFISNGLQGTSIVFPPGPDEDPRIYSFGMGVPRAVGLVVATSAWILDNLGDHELAVQVLDRLPLVLEKYGQVAE